MYTTEQEITCQNNALNELSHGDCNIALQYFEWDDSKIFVIFREIINEFEIDLNRVPSSDELIWIASEMLNRNIRTLY